MKKACDCVVLLPFPPFLPCLVCLLGPVSVNASVPIVDVGIMMMMPSFQRLRVSQARYTNNYLFSNANHHASRCRYCCPSFSRLYSGGSSVWHACPAKGERTRRRIGRYNCGQRICKACSVLAHSVSLELDANTHNRIRPPPRRALLGSALPVNVDLAFPTSALEFCCTARVLVQL